jgi:peptide/nickel transport system substrate-binding protein
MIMRFALIAAVLLLLTACGGPGSDAPPEAERYGGTVTVGHMLDVPTMLPVLTREGIGHNLRRFVLFTPVLRLDERFDPAPWLARAWEVHPAPGDSLELTFQLRDDVYWHDGVKTTAYDLEHAWSQQSYSYYGAGTATDSFTFTVRLEPHAEFLHLWRTVIPLPRHLLGDVPTAALAEHPFGTEQPVGNGPFRFVERQPGVGWTFAANPDFPAALGGRPFLDTLHYRVIPDPQTRLAEFEAGRLDVLLSLDGEQLTRIEEVAAARVRHFPTTHMGILVWNHRKPLFQDARVRRALTMAIDRERLIETLRHGRGAVANTSVPPLHWAFDAGAGADLRYDPEAATALLREAGWWDRDGDGVLRNASGAPFRFAFQLIRNDHAAEAYLTAIRGWLREIGIEAKLQPMDIPELLASQDFDARAQGLQQEFRLDDRGSFHCRWRDTRGSPSGYCSPEADRLLDTLQLVRDRQDARPLWIEYQRVIARDQPYTFLWYSERSVAFGTHLQDVEPDARGELQNVARWWVRPS